MKTSIVLMMIIMIMMKNCELVFLVTLILYITIYIYINSSKLKIHDILYYL